MGVVGCEGEAITCKRQNRHGDGVGHLLWAGGLA